MGFWKNLIYGEDPPQAEPEVAPVVEQAPEPPADSDEANCDFHIARFSLALEQCAKGGDRKDQLQQNLDYWLAVKAARHLKPGV